MVKKDQLGAIAVMKRRQFFRFYSKWLLWKPATPFWGFNLKHWYHWRQQFLLYDKTRFDFQTSTYCNFLFLCVHWAKVLTVNSCFQYFLQALCWNNLFLQQTQWTNFLVSRQRSVVMFTTAVCLIFLLKLKWPKNKSVYDFPLGHCITTLLVFDYPKFQ